MPELDDRREECYSIGMRLWSMHAVHLHIEHQHLFPTLMHEHSFILLWVEYRPQFPRNPEEVQYIVRGAVTSLFLNYVYECDPPFVDHVSENTHINKAHE